MFNLYMVVYTAILFYLLTPGVYLRLPRKGSKIIVALTHGVVFAVVLFSTYKIVLRLTGQRYDGFKDLLAAPIRGSGSLADTLYTSDWKTPDLKYPKHSKLKIKQQADMRDLRKAQLEDYKKSINSGNTFDRQKMLDDVKTLRDKQKKDHDEMEAIAKNALKKYKEGKKGTLEYLLKNDPNFKFLPEIYKEKLLSDAYSKL